MSWSFWHRKNNNFCFEAFCLRNPLRNFKKIARQTKAKIRGVGSEAKQVTSQS
jgi:hypothetical protein